MPGLLDRSGQGRFDNIVHFPVISGKSGQGLLSLFGQVIQHFVHGIVGVSGKADSAHLRSGGDLSAAVQNYGDGQHAIEGGMTALTQGVA